MDRLDKLVNRRTEVLGLRVSLAEKSVLADAAAALGYSVGTYCRVVALAAAKRTSAPTIRVGRQNVPLISEDE